MNSTIHIKIHLLLPIILMLLLFLGCVNPIDLEIPKGLDDSIVIDAKIIKGQPSTIRLEISQLFNFTVTSKTRVVAKTLILKDDLGSEMEIPAVGNSLYDYKFKDTDPITIEFGHSYQISLEMPDGRKFESSLETLYPVPPIDSITYRFFNKTFAGPDGIDRELPSVEYTVSTSLLQPNKGEKSQLRWVLEKVYKVTDTPRDGTPPKTCFLTRWTGAFDVLLYDAQGTTKTKLVNHILYDENVDETYAEGQYFTIYQESLTPNANEYWQKIKFLIDRNDSLYPNPPGKVESNFSHINGDEEVYGFFYLTERDTARIYLDPKLLNFPRRRCPPRLPADQLCADCLSQEKSVKEKPEFWVH